MFKTSHVNETHAWITGEDAILGSINLNIRWHQTQLLSSDHAYAYVTPGLRTYFSDISISKKKMETIPFSYAYAYAYVAPGLCLCLCLCLCRSVNQA